MCKFKGFIQCDAAPGLDTIFANGNRIEVGCDAHSWRKHFKCLENSPKSAGVEKSAAIGMSIISSAKRHGIEPLPYLKDIFTRINSTGTDELHQFLPRRMAQIAPGLQ